MGVVAVAAIAQDPFQRHNLDELSLRQSDKPWVRMYSDGQFSAERTIFRDLLTGAEIWRLTDDSREDRHNDYDIPVWSSDGEAMIFLRENDVVPSRLWLMPADASWTRPVADFSEENLLDPELPIETATKDSFWSWADPSRIYSMRSGVVSLIHPRTFEKTDVFDLMTSPIVDNPDLPVLEKDDFVMMPPHPLDDRLLFHTSGKGRLFSLDLVTLQLSEISTDGRWELPGNDPNEVAIQSLRWTKESGQLRLFIGQDARVENGVLIADPTQYIATMDGVLSDYNLEGYTQRGDHPDLSMAGKVISGNYDGSMWMQGIDGAADTRLTYGAKTTQHHASYTWDDRWLATDNGLYESGLEPVELRGFDVEQSIVLVSKDGRAQNVLSYHYSSYASDEATHPGPTSSPDGTKIVYDSDMLDPAAGEGGDLDGNPDLWMVVVRPPGQPRDVALRSSSDRFRLKWLPPRHAAQEVYWNPSNEAREIRGYNVLRGLASGGPYEQLNVEPVPSGTYDDTTVEAGVNYYYVVQSVEHSGLVSVYSREVFGSTTSRRWRGDVLHFYEAEDAEMTLPMVPQVEAGTASGDWFAGTFAQVPDPAYPLEPGPAAVTFDVYPPVSDDYTVWARLKGFDFGGTIEVEIDGVLMGELLVVEPGDWGWVALSATVRPRRGGKHTIRLSTEDTEIGIDMLALSSGLEGEPPPFGNRDITAPAPPSNPRLVSIADNTKQIVWSPSPDGDVQYYNVYCGRDTSYPLGNENILRSPTATTVFDWGIPAGIPTVYKITAVDRYGNESEAIVFDPGVQSEESAPEAFDDGYSVDQGEVLDVPALGVLANDIDGDGDVMTAAIVTGVQNGVLELLEDGGFIYTPNPVFSGVDSFTYSVSDGVSISNIATVIITVVGAVGGPVAHADAYFTDEDVNLAVGATDGVLANDTGGEGETLTAILVTSTQHGTLGLSPTGAVNYWPGDDFNGTDSFTYQASNGVEVSNIAEVILTVTAVNDAPTSADDSFAVDQDTVLDIPAPGVLANDADIDGDPVTAMLVTSPADGMVDLRANGRLIYTPNPNFAGVESFTYRVTDGQLNSNDSQIWIEVRRVDDQPTFYVASSGSDSSGDGSEANPWKTIQKAANTMSSGDRAVVLSGDYPERVSVPTAGLSFEAQGSVDMKGFAAHVDGLTVRGFKIEADDCSWQDGWGVFIEGADALVEDNHFFNNCGGGIRFFAEGFNDPGTSNNTARNNRFENNGMVGIQVEGQNSLVEGNEVWNTLQYHPKWAGGAPEWVDADGIRFFGNGHTISNNFIHDISFAPPENVNPHIDCFQTWGPASDILFEDNSCSLPEGQQEGLDGSQGFMIEGAVSDVVIRRNTIEAFRQINSVGVDGLTIVNNLLLSSLAFDGLWQQAVNMNGVDRGVFKNNVVLDIIVNYVATPGSNVEAGFNSVWRSDGGPLPDSPFPDDLWGLDPRLNESYEPLPGSPLIDAGADVGLPFEGAGPDIGLHESAP